MSDVFDPRAGTLVASTTDGTLGQGPAACAGDCHAITVLLHGNLAARLTDLKQAVNTRCELVSLDGPRAPVVDCVIFILPPSEAFSVTQDTFQTIPDRLELSLEITVMVVIFVREVESIKLIVIMFFQFLGGKTNVLERISFRPDNCAQEWQINC